MTAPTLDSLKPMLLTDGKRPFNDPGWLFEIKHDIHVRCPGLADALQQ